MKVHDHSTCVHVVLFLSLFVVLYCICMIMACLPVPGVTGSRLVVRDDSSSSCNTNTTECGSAQLDYFFRVRNY